MSLYSISFWMRKEQLLFALKTPSLNDIKFDSFKKIIVIGEESPVIRDESGITTISIYDFLLKDNSLEL